MLQLNLYIPAPLEKKIRSEARRRGKSVSAHVADLLAGQIEPRRWHRDFFAKVVGGWKGEFPPIPRDPPVERDGL